MNFVQIKGHVYEEELQTAVSLSRTAGARILEFYNGKARVTMKRGVDAKLEPVTEADHASNELIVTVLARDFPRDGILAEESVDTDVRLGARRVWMVDPMDGTNGFIARDGDFAVQIGLTVDGECALGVVYEPARDLLLWAVKGAGAWRQTKISGAAERVQVSRERDFANMTLAASRTHRSPRMDRVVTDMGFEREVRRGSVGVKIGLIVQREADLYIHLSPRTKQWDTCAPEIIVREAGGELTDLFGARMRYNTRDVQNHNGIVATNGATHADVIARLAPLLSEFERKRVEIA